ncbi:MAG: 1-deoxy-D-xylulose-5-phosphate reductoisomerase [Nitrospirae bacterium]|nr:1-deoxy-D-xylulose-5-phosphate reductoisomerase [Nitrospirota bacterium]
MKRLTILGSTGSIGRNALEIVSRNRDRFRVVVLTAWNNIDLLEKQIKSFAPELVAVSNEESARKLQKRFGRKLSFDILSGANGIEKAAAHENSDFVLSAIVGAAGLMPTLAAIRSGKTIGLANKETLVVAGEIVTEESKKYKAKILPVDSEHSAIFQCMEGHKKTEIKRIILTASGGPFAGMVSSEMNKITPEEALKHPRWKMGKKITIDSATLMNKGFEVIEAHYLFGLPPSSIDVVVHPQSIVHSLVEFYDGSSIAQLSYPDMRGPISYALTYPDRISGILPGLELSKIGKLEFTKPDTKCFPCLSYAYLALKAGGTMPAVLNAANEVAVNSFLNREIRFKDIPFVIKKTMSKHVVTAANELSRVLEADRWARDKAKEVVNRIKT